MLTELGRSLRELVFPPICLMCNAIIEREGEHFCSTCTTALTDDPHLTCPRCSSSIGEFADVSKGCPRCRDDRFQFESSFRLGLYDGLLRDAISAASNRRLGKCWPTVWETVDPSRGSTLSRSRRSRRYSRAVALVAQMAARFQPERSVGGSGREHLNLPCHTRWLKRIRDTPHQMGLGAVERRANMRGAFKATRNADLKGQTVLLVDDVLTTGSTASEAARALRDAAERASSWPLSHIAANEILTIRHLKANLTNTPNAHGTVR